MSPEYKCLVCGETREDKFTQESFMGSLMMVCKSCRGRRIFTGVDGPKN